MKKYKIFLIGTLLMIPTIVFASSGSDDEFPIMAALMMEAFVSIHMSVFVLMPLSNLISKENSKNTFLTLFAIRVGILLFFDFFITTAIAVIDFLAVFVGAFLIVPIVSIAKKTTPYQSRQQTNKISDTTNKDSKATSQVQTNTDVILKCKKCGNTLKITDKYCSNCGEPFYGNKGTVPTQKKVLVNASNYDPIFNNTEDKLLEEFINKELIKVGIPNGNSLPSDLLKRKNILNGIFSILVFIFVSSIFFHFPIYTYIIEFLILFLFFQITKRYNLIKYLKKEIKSRPSEKISNIVMNIKNSLVDDNTRIIRVIGSMVAIVLPFIIFMNPRIMYEKVDGGYAVRFYAFGLTNFKTATIPESHNGEPVVSLRGNSFSNMPFLERVSLPNTITEIRGQAFKNDKRLVSVNIPTSLEYLGGGSFYNCVSLSSVALPDTLTYMGGETFYNATSLKYVRLSSNLTEIRGDSFKYCTSLRSIQIPDSVTRIGGHAFYGASSLSEVIFTKNSRLNEIGSSAFRSCTRLYTVTIPRTVSVNERAFKESPTIVSYFN